jgi:hypothetical protein
MELSRSQFPAGGWQFFQSQTNWHAPTPVSSTFDQTVDLIRKHRLANPAVTKQHNLATDFNSVAMELEAYTRTRLGMGDTFSQPALRPGERQTAGKCCGQI